MSSIREVVTDYLAERDIPHVVEDGGEIVGFLSASENGSWTVYVLMLEADEQVVVHSVFNPPVPEESRNAVAMLLTRANFGILHGNFELDLDDGTLRYKTSLDVRGGELTEQWFENIVAANVGMFDRYVPAIEAVVDGEDPVKAVAAVEESLD
jgi:hypothetical protein